MDSPSMDGGSTSPRSRDYLFVTQSFRQLRDQQFGRLLLLLLPCLIALEGPTLFGLDRDVQIDQLHHTAWTADNATVGETKQVVQTSDGFLWLLTSDDRLLRFDGIRFEPIETAMAGVLPTGEHRWDDVFTIEVVPDGGLWIGHALPRVDLVKNGQVHTFSTENCFPNAPIERMVRDHDGVLWIGTPGGLGRLQDSQCDSIGPSWGYSGGRLVALLVDRAGTLWVKSQDGRLFFLRHGAKAFEINASGSGNSEAESALAQAPDGSIWQATSFGIQRILQGRDDHPGIRGPMLGPHAAVSRILFDRDGALWFVMQDGIHRIPYPDRLVPWQPRRGENIPAKSLTPSVKADGSFQTFTIEQGLSSDVIWNLFQDREGDIWTATGAGVDRFRNNAFIRAPLKTTQQGQFTFATGERGTVWAANWASPLFNLADRVLTTHPFTEQNISALYRDPSGVVWVGTLGKPIWHSSGSGFVRAGWPDGEIKTYVRAMSMDRAGGLWVSLATGGVFRLAEGAWTRQNDRLGIPASIAVYAIVTDDQGRVWFDMGRRIYVLDGDQVRKFDHSNGLEIGYATVIEVKGMHTWLGGLFGVALLMDNHFQVIKGVGGEVFHVTSAIIERPDGEVWVNTGSGAVRIPASEVQKAIRDPAYQVRFQRFDALDGLDGKATYWIPVPTAIAGLDGKLWFSTNKGVFWVDPERTATHRNLERPPVYVTSITSAGKRFPISDRLQLPAHTDSIQIDYTALSLAIPERVNFRYRLEGVDRQWQDAGTRRQSFYTNLSPGDYRFQVIASNEDGVWNDAGAVLRFVTFAAWYQTLWFRCLCAIAILGALWSLYLLRLTKVTADINARLSERLKERERIARELHDTLLQSFQGLVLHFQRARNLLPARPMEAVERLDTALERAESAIAEGRNAIHDIRSSALVDGDFAQAMTAVGEELSAGDISKDLATFNVVVEGSVKPLDPILRDEMYRIAREALRNAFSHAAAHHIEAEIAYGEKLFRVRIRDDGKGVDARVLDQGERAGHWGLPGMRERAEQVGGQLKVWSEAGAGTEIELSVPGSVAYRTSSSQAGFALFHKNGKHNDEHRS
jgi:signal transduction histidine kinase/ligand-binding sensor domain-containing protein